MPDQKDEPNRTHDGEPDKAAPDDGEPDRGNDERLKGATRLPRKGDELDDLHGTPTD